jgi:hypothetical protein
MNLIIKEVPVRDRIGYFNFTEGWKSSRDNTPLQQKEVAHNLGLTYYKGSLPFKTGKYSRKNVKVHFNENY